MNVKIDEDEHSIEMQLPYLAHVFKDKLDKVTFIPGMRSSLISNYQRSLWSQVFDVFDLLFLSQKYLYLQNRAKTRHDLWLINFTNSFHFAHIDKKSILLCYGV